MMRKFAKLRKDEAGYALVWVLLVLIVAGLVLGPLLLLMGASLTSSHVHEESTQRFYAADAGIEDGIYRIANDIDLPTPDNPIINYDLDEQLNNCTIEVTIAKHPGEDNVYVVTSVATNNDSDMTTTITTVESYISVVWGSGDFGEFGDLPVSDPLNEPGDIEIDEGVRVEGDITIGNGNLKILGVNVIVEGNVDVGDGNLEVYDDSNLIVCGNIHVDENLKILGTGNVVVQGNVDVGGDLEVNADTNLTVCGNVDVDGNLVVNGNLSVGGEGDPVDANVDVEGNFEVYGAGIVCGNVDVGDLIAGAGNLIVGGEGVLCVAETIDVGGSTVNSGELSVGEGCLGCPPEACPPCGTGETVVSVESYQLE